MEQYGKFNTLDEVYAATFGIIKKNYPTIQRSVFNKLLVEYGLEKVDKEYFLMLVDRVKNNIHLEEIYIDAVNGKYALEDIHVYNTVKDEDLFNIVTPYSIDKLTNQAQSANFRKAQRQGTAQYYLSQQITQSLTSVLQSIEPVVTQDPSVVVTNKELIIGLSDWHIGARVDNVNGNSFNVEIAQKRLNDYLDSAYQALTDSGASKIYLLHGGDFIEGIDMRKVNQAFDAEIDATTQISVATRMMIDAVRRVSSWGVPLTVALVGGNHDRFTANKKDAIYNDNIAYNILDTLLLMNSYKLLGNNTEIIDNRNDVYRVELNIAGKNIMLIHGDTLPNTDKPKIPSLIKNHPIDLVFYGHYHSSRFIQENGSAFSIMIGSIMGNNTYSKALNLPDSRASQLITVLDTEHESPVFQPVFL